MTGDINDIESIIEGCKRGDRKAQEQLYRSYYRAMMSLCLRYTQNDADAMEVLNTGFYKVFRSIDRYDSKKSAIYTWIRTILINCCLDFLKSKDSIIVTVENTQAAEAHLPPEVFTKMSAAEILNLVRKLPPATRVVFNLYVTEGFNHREIAGLMQISEGTSKWHLSEARKQLQKMIKDQKG